MEKIEIDVSGYIKIHLLNHHMDLVEEIIKSGVVDTAIASMEELSGGSFKFENLDEEAKEVLIKSIPLWIIMDRSTEANTTLEAARILLQYYHPEWGKLDNDDIKAKYFEITNNDTPTDDLN